MPFPKTIDMKPFELVNTALQDCYSPSNVAVIDSLLFILDSKELFQFVKIYHKNRFTPLGGFGKIGKGPGEYINPTNISVNEGLKIVMFLESPRKRINCFKLGSAINNPSGNPSPCLRYPIDDSLMPISSFFLLDNWHVMVSTSRSNACYTIIDSVGTIVESFGDIAQDRQGLSQFAFNNFYSRPFAYSAERRQAISAFMKFDAIQTYNFGTNVTETYRGINYKRVLPEVAPDGVNILNTYLAFASIKQHGPLIFASFLGGITFNPADYSSTLPSDILVFNWQMKPVARLKFPVQIEDFAVDGSNIYVISSCTETSLSVYSLESLNL